MKNLNYLFIFAISVLAFKSCATDVDVTSDLNYINFESAEFDFGVDLFSTNEREVVVYSTQVKGKDRIFDILVDLEATTADVQAYTVPATVTIPANSNEGTLNITVSDINIGEEGKKIVLKLVAQQGLFIGNAITLNISQVCPSNEVILNITFDGYSEECSWELLDSTGAIISEFAYAAGIDVASKKFCLDDGDYTFKVYDAYGDGLSYPNSGKVALIYKGAELGSAVGDFGASATIEFTVAQ